MADVTKTKGTLQLTYTRSDGSSDIWLLDNAKASIAAADIASLESFIANNNIIIGDGNASFSAFSDVRVISNEKTILDLS